MSVKLIDCIQILGQVADQNYVAHFRKAQNIHLEK